MAAFVALIVSSKSRFVYYTFLLGFSKFVVPLLKMAYAQPRPFWLDAKIQPFKCSLCFGNPSGHSFSAILAATCIILDVFHGSPANFNNWSDENAFFSGWTYYPSLLFALLWSLSMPYTRYVGGMHSLDQLATGFLFGLFFAFIAHFLVRDPLIRFVERSIHLQKMEDRQQVKLKLGQKSMDLSDPLLEAGEKESEEEQYKNPPSKLSMLTLQH